MALRCNTLLAVCKGCAQTEWRSTAIATVHSQVFVTRQNSLSFCSVSSKFVSSDVILVDTGCQKHFPDLRNHAWWSRDIENGPRRSFTYLDNIALSIGPVSPSHFLLERRISDIVAMSWKFGLLFSSLSKLSRNGEHPPACGWSKRDTTYAAADRDTACFTMLKKGVIPIPPPRSTAGLAEVLCSVRSPSQAPPLQRYRSALLSMTV